LRRLALYLSAALLAALVLLLAGLFWLLNTSEGARFALATLSGAAGARLSVQRIEGRLIDRLELTGVRLSEPGRQTQIDRLQFDWEPRRLLHENLLVRKLILSGVRIQDDTPPVKKAPRLHWPRVSGALARLDARIDRLQLTGLSYRQLEAPPVLVSQLSSSLTFKDGLLTLPQLSLVTPQGRLSGEMAAGFRYPSLKLDLALVPALPVRELDFFSLQTRLLPGRDPEQLAGSFALAGRGGGAQRLELAGQLGMTEKGFNLRGLNLVRPGVRGSLTGKGSLTLTETEPVYVLDLQAQELDLASELKTPTSLSGTLSFSGTPSRYLGRFDLSNRGPGWQNAALAADYRGGSAGVTLSSVSGAVLEGRLSGALEVGWSQGVRISGTLAGRELNPAQLAAGWSGLVNLDLTGNLEIPAEGALRGELRGKLLKSRLRDQDLQGELLAAFAGERLRIDRLLLAGCGFQLKAAGELDRRLNVAARVSDLSRLLPGSAGALQGDGWLRWQGGVLAGAATGQGSNLVVAGVGAKALQLKASLGEGEGYPVRLEAVARRLQFGGVQAESALVNLQGRAALHTLTARLYSPVHQAQLTLAGGYANGVWRGELASLSGRDRVGPWSLAAPAPLTLSAAFFRLAPLTINGLPGERLELAGELNRQKDSGALRAEWGGLNLARANDWLSGVQVSGASSGNLELTIFPGRRVAVSGRGDLRGTLLSDGRSVTLDRLAVSVQGDGRGLRAALDLALQGGTGEAQLSFDSQAPATLALPGEGDLRLQWSSFDLALLAPFMPPELALDGRLAGLVTGKLLPGGRLDLRGNAALDEGQLSWGAQGEQLDAELETAELGFSWRGRPAGAGKGAQGVLNVKGRAAASGAYTANGQRIDISRCTLRIDADPDGTRAALDLALAGGGTLRGSLSSDSPAGPGLPESAELALQWGGIDPLLLKPWLPAALNLEGRLGGEARGRILPGRRLEVAGEAEFSQGKAQWQGVSGEMKANLRSASLSFAWRAETLSGSLSLALAEYGQAQGDFVLPIPARLPVAARPEGALSGAFSGKLKERGFLTAFFPGLVQESHGELALDVTLGGVWSDPRVLGSLQLAKAGAYLPSAGIRVSDLQLSARLDGNQIRIERFRALSGKGHLEGEMLVRLEGGQVASYRGGLRGERFQTVYLPELQLVTSPLITFEGSPGGIILQGELRIPEMLITGPPGRQVVTASSDVIMEGAPVPSAGDGFPLKVGGRIRVVLGDKVRVEMSGIDARLGGGMDLVFDGIDSISSRGEIKVVEGRYRAYGVDLDIVRGRLYYVDEPIDQPTLDILALSTVGDVRAGVTVAGFLGAPVIKLYSEPPMPEVDILSYMVLGHPLGSSNTDQGSMLATAASSLLSFGESQSLQEQIKDRLGLSVAVETVDTSRAGLMGYKPVPVAPGGAPASTVAGESLLTVGKYLTPKLYLSYGRSFVTGGNLFRIRYDIFRHWQVETQSGTESGVDLYYKLEFN